jgi:hypothetical protein
MFCDLDMNRNVTSTGLLDSSMACLALTTELMVSLMSAPVVEQDWQTYWLMYDW